MQVHVVSFAVLLCLGISLRLLQPDTGQWTNSFLAVAGFLAAGSLLSLFYRARFLAYLLLLGVLSFFMVAMPLNDSRWVIFIGIFIVLAVIALALIFFKIKALLPWTLSALFLGFGVTALYLDYSSPRHLINWAKDGFDDITILYGTIIKEPEVRPEQRRTMLSVSPSLVVRLTEPDSFRRFELILNALNSLPRKWKTEEEALRTLLLTRDRIKAEGEKDPAGIIAGLFNTRDALLDTRQVEAVLAVLKELDVLPASLIDKGWAWVTVIEPEDPEQREKYLDISYHTGYGYLLKLTSSLRPPNPASNPGVFDYQKYLYGINHYAIMRVDLAREADSLQILERRPGNFFIAWCLDLKYHFLDTLRQLIPFPESSFLAGIFLGLRRGVTDKIMYDSRVAGTGHIFAVSGLHVTIITGLLLLIFNQTPIPKTVWAPIAVFFLLIFTVITGARPSTLRASIMNSFALVFFTYFGKKIAVSLLMSICVAAILILTVLPPGYGGPILLPEASFLMSFSAVLFLGILSRPVEHYLNVRLVNLQRFAIFAFIAVFIGLIFINLSYPAAIFSSKAFWIFLLAIPACYFIQRVIPFRPRFTAIPSSWLRTFIAAQIAIQASIIPLSAVIFHTLSIAGAFANFIAIPLIGVVLPLGMLATLISYIPFVGMQIALLLTAGNWIGVRFFILLDDFFARYFPFPQVPKPGPVILIVFYGLIAIFIARERVFLRMRIAFLRVKNSSSNSSARLRLIAAGALLLVGAFSLGAGLRAARRPLLEVTFLDLSYPGTGMASLIETPTGETILIDGGFEGHVYGRPINQGQRIIQDILLSKKIVNLDAVVNTHLDPRLLGGLNYIVDSPNYHVQRLYASLPPADFGPDDIDLDRFAEALTPIGKKSKEKFYRLLLLGYWQNPNDVEEFRRIYQQVNPERLNSFLDTLEGKTKFSAQDAILLLEDNKNREAKNVIDSIVLSYSRVGRRITREEAQKIAEDWDLPLLSTNDYRQLAVELPLPVLCFVYQEGGLLADPAVLEAYRRELEERFYHAVRDTRDFSELRNEDIEILEERFLQYHRLLFAAKRKNIPTFSSHAGVNLAKSLEAGGKQFAAVIVSPPAERFSQRYAADQNSTVISIRFGDVSFLFPTMINQGASEHLLRLSGGIKHTIYLVPQFGRGGAYVDRELMMGAVGPEVAIFQAREGRYPDQYLEEGWTLCQKMGIKAYHTQRSGAVIVTTDGEQYWVKTTLGEKEPLPDEAAPDQTREVEAAF